MNKDIQDLKREIQDLKRMIENLQKNQVVHNHYHNHYYEPRPVYPFYSYPYYNSPYYYNGTGGNIPCNTLTVDTNKGSFATSTTDSNWLRGESTN